MIARCSATASIALAEGNDQLLPRSDKGSVDNHFNLCMNPLWKSKDVDRVVVCCGGVRVYPQVQGEASIGDGREEHGKRLVNAGPGSRKINAQSFAVVSAFTRVPN